MQKIRKGDDVVVLTGKDKGKRGVVLRVLDGQLVVEGVNVVKKHQKPNPIKGVQGGVVEKTMPEMFPILRYLTQLLKKQIALALSCWMMVVRFACSNRTAK